MKSRKSLIACKEHGSIPVTEVCGICHSSLGHRVEELECALDKAPGIITELSEEGTMYERVLKEIAEMNCECNFETIEEELHVEHSAGCPVGIADAALDGCEVRILAKRGVKK